MHYFPSFAVQGIFNPETEHHLHGQHAGVKQLFKVKDARACSVLIDPDT